MLAQYIEREMIKLLFATAKETAKQGIFSSVKWNHSIASFWLINAFMYANIANSTVGMKRCECIPGDCITIPPTNTLRKL